MDLLRVVPPYRFGLPTLVRVTLRVDGNDLFATTSRRSGVRGEPGVHNIIRCVDIRLGSDPNVPKRRRHEVLFVKSQKVG